MGSYNRQWNKGGGGDDVRAEQRDDQNECERKRGKVTGFGTSLSFLSPSYPARL